LRLFSFIPKTDLALQIKINFMTQMATHLPTLLNQNSMELARVMELKLWDYEWQSVGTQFRM